MPCIVEHRGHYHFALTVDEAESIGLAYHCQAVDEFKSDFKRTRNDRLIAVVNVEVAFVIVHYSQAFMKAAGMVVLWRNDPFPFFVDKAQGGIFFLPEPALPGRGLPRRIVVV